MKLLSIVRIVLGAATIVVLLGEETPHASAATPSACVVDRVVDGDTFACADGTVVDLMEVYAPPLGDCGGDWAAAALGGIFLPKGRNVSLTYGVVQVGAAGHAIAAPIWRGADGADYNLSVVMVYVGLAKAGHYDGNSLFADWLNAADNWAHQAQWNMWAPGKPYNGAADCPDQPSALPAPALRSPRDGSVLSNFPRTTAFQWSPVSNAATYTLEVDYHWGLWQSEFGLRPAILFADLNETTYTTDFVGAQPGRWRVRAVDVTGRAGPWSAWWGFTYTR